MVCDPDQSTLAIDLPGAPAPLVERVVALRSGTGIRNGAFVREVPRGSRAMGARDVSVERFPLVLTTLDDAFGLPTWAEYWRDAGPFDDSAVAAWAAAVDRARRAGGFRYAVDYVVVAATLARY